MDGLRTWIEIDKRALHHNVGRFLKLIPERTQLMAVVKSNAYGHGLTQVALQFANSKFEIRNSKPIWFGVDSIVEALTLRREGIKNPILVFGSTLSVRFAQAASEDVIVTISNFESLVALAKEKKPPVFHLA